MARPSAAVFMFQMDNPLRAYYPTFDRPQGHPPPHSPGHSDSRSTIQPFILSTAISHEMYIQRVQDFFRSPANMTLLQHKILLQDAIDATEICNEADTSHACSKHIFDPALTLLVESGRIHNGAEIKHTRETAFIPRGMTYFSTKKGKVVPLSLRTDLMYVFKTPTTNLNVGDMMPGLPTRPFAIIELKRFGTFDAMVAELEYIALHGTRDQNGFRMNNVGFSADTQEFLRQLALYCLGAKTQFGTLCDYKSLILIQFTGMTIRPGMTPMQNYQQGHGGSFTFSIVKNHREKPLALAGWLRFAAESTAPHI